MRPDFRVSVGRIVGALLAGMFLLAALSVAGQLYKTFSDTPIRGLFSLVQLFDVKKEESIPTWYSEVLLLLCSALLAVIFLAIRREGGRRAGYWLGLSAVFLFLSADEGSSIHEKMGQLGKFILAAVGIDQSGFLTYAWVVPGAALVLVLALVYLGFFFGLPTKYRLLFLAAGIVYVGGALVLESISAFYVSLYGGQQTMTGGQRATVVAITTAEESTEMLGAILFIYALLSYLREYVENITLRFGDKKTP